MRYAKEAIFQLLDTVGDGSGIKEAIGDYSSNPTSFRLKHNSGKVRIIRMIVMVEDTGSFDSGLYGNGVSLTNGIRVYVRNKADEIIQEYTSFPILTNGDWAGHCHDFNHFTYGSGNEVASIRWTFNKSGQAIFLDFFQGDYLEVYLEDDFSDLVKHRFSVQGHYLDKHEQI